MQTQFSSYILHNIHIYIAKQQYHRTYECACMAKKPRVNWAMVLVHNRCNEIQSIQRSTSYMYTNISSDVKHKIANNNKKNGRASDRWQIQQPHIAVMNATTVIYSTNSERDFLLATCYLLINAQQTQTSSIHVYNSKDKVSYFLAVNCVIGCYQIRKHRALNI